MVLFLLAFVLNNGGGSNQSVEMTGLGREKLTAFMQWNGNCVVDEINYITNKNATATVDCPKAKVVEETPTKVVIQYNR